MIPKLVVVAGPKSGEILPVDQTPFSIGRDAANQLPINDSSLSRRHCAIEKSGDSFVIRDLDSLNGTVLNHVPVREHLLKHGDQIQVCSSLLLFLERESDDNSLPIQFDAAPHEPGKTIPLNPKNAIYLNREIAESRGQTKSLNALLQISNQLPKHRTRESLCHHLLELTIEVIPAQRGTIVLADENIRKANFALSLDRSGKSIPVCISSTVADQVYQTGEALLCEDVAQHEQLKEAKSLAGAEIRSVLCAPLLIGKYVAGILYMESTTTPLNEEHLQVLTAAVNMGALAIENLQHLQWLEGETRRLSSEIQMEHSLIGESASMKEVLRLIERVSATDSTVLVLGESGTGKELVARAIHQNSPRASRPFVAINCAALTETLLESELFGHEKGAFTGAVAQKRGKFEVAGGGTLFLDEIAELAPHLQSKLLRVLQEREIERIGGLRPIPIDVRLIAATNKDPKESMAAGSFRQDLYYRLNVVSVTIPALRERKKDIPLLAMYFVAKYSEKVKRKVQGVSPEARTYLQSYDWPGNVRELENAIERAVVLGSTSVILPEDLPEQVREVQVPASASSSRYQDAITDLKKQLIRDSVRQADGNYTEAAKLLGVHPNYLHRLIRNLNMKKEL